MSALIAAGIFFAERCEADVRGVPEFALYVTHNSMFRSRVAANATWSDDKSDFTSASAEYDLDIGLMSFFRRYIFKDPNFEKSKRVTFRLGYAYYGDLDEGSFNTDEKRALAEATFRQPLGKAWLLSDRNRGELRRIDGREFGRYRNRLRLERNVAISKFKITPYAHAEVFYEGLTDKWDDQFDGTVGAEFPWRHQTVLELYFTWQFIRDRSDNQTVGVTLQKHL